MDLLASTSMSPSDFAEVDMGETNSTTVELRVSFDWSSGGYSASDSSTSQFDVSVAHQAQPSITANSLTVDNPPTVSNDSGSLSSLEIPKDDFSFSFDYSSLNSGSHSIDFALEAKLESASSFETVFSESFNVEGDSGTASDSKLSTSFPVDLLANTSMSASDFEESNDGDTEVTTVDFRVLFDWSDGEYSSSDMAIDSFDVTVTNQEVPSLTVSSLASDPPFTFDNDAGEPTSLELKEEDFSFSLDYSGFETGTHSVNFELEAKLESDSSFESLFSKSFDISGTNGTVSESKVSDSFPVDLLANTSMTVSDFEEPNAGETETTIVDFRVSFDWSGSEYSASDSDTGSFDVSVTNTSPTYIIIDFEEGNLDEWSDVSGYMEIDSDHSYSKNNSAWAAANGAGFSTVF